MKEDLVLVKTILKEQSSMRVVLNGGKYELEDSTIPFQIGFDSSIAEQKPTHILVVDVTNEDTIKSAISDNCRPDCQADRTIFKLEPINYLQLRRPGVHHLIFILFNEMDQKKQKHYLEKGQYGYNNTVYFNTIEEIKLNGQVSYAEAVVDVPKEFFADEPETRFQKAIYSWVNSWYKLKPVDECEYRKRKIIGFTIKPLLWFLGFIPRVIVATLLSLFVFVIKLIAFLFGWQPVLFLPKKKEVWSEFLFLYPYTGYGKIFKSNFWFGKIERGVDDTDCYGHKVIAIGKNRFHIPITISGLMFYASSVYLLIITNHKLIIGDTKGMLIEIILLSILVSVLITVILVFVTLSTLKPGKEWETKWDIANPEGKKLVARVVKVVFIPLIVIIAVSLCYPYVSIDDLSQFLILFSKFIVAVAVMFGVSLFISKKVYPIISKKIEEIKKENFASKAVLPEEVKVNKEEVRKMEWLQKSFAIEKLPEKVEFKTAPVSSSVLHEFTISFWRLKAKVCKPYAKK